jgi:Ca2+-binding RTX toxin-like protein
LNVSYTLGGAATRGSDYTGTSPGTATFAAGSATTNITLPTINDTVVDPNETLIATIAAPSGYKISGSASATATIADNDGSGSDFSNPTSIAIPESGASTPYPSTINVSGLSGNLASLEVTLTDLNHTYSDDIDVLLVGPTGAKVILMSDVGGSDGVNNLTLTFDPSATAGLPDAGQITSGTYRPTDFGPGDLFDSPAPAGPYGTAFSVFNNTNPNGTWSLYVIDDGSGDSGTIAGGWSLNIGTNTPVGGTIAIAKTTDGKEAGPVSSVFILTRTGSTAAALNVSYTLTGTATRGSDYTGTSPGTATFAAGATTTTVTLPTINDTVVDPIETIIATIAAPTGYTISGAASASATIVDNDIAPVGTIAIAKTTDGREAGPVSSVFTLTRTGSTAAALNVSYTLTGTATRGTDYTGTSPGTATFAAGATTTTVTLPTINDTVVDPNETIIATITAPTGYTISGAASATDTIADNDGSLPIISLTSNYSGVSENGTPNLVYTFNRTGATTQALAVNFTVGGTATQGTDFLASGATLSGSNGIINFATGSAIATLTVNPIADTIKEADDTVDLNLVASTGYQVGTPTPVTTTIINDDGTLNQRGTYGNDFIEAGSALVLSGRSGNDVLIGSRANDILSGGQGADILTGGAGSDLFSFSTPQDGIDRITDFNPVEDLIQISAAGFAGGLTMGEALSLSQFSLGTVTATTRFTFNAATGSLFFDSDGNGGAAPFQIASLNSGLTLTNENIFVS